MKVETMDMQALYELYVVEAGSDIGEHLPTLHMAVTDRNAKQVIELGVRTGRSTAALLAAVEQTGGQVWSCDVTGPKIDPLIAEHERWTIRIGDDIAVADTAPEQCDVLFIDTSHDYGQTLAELDAYAPKVRAGGVILLHDTALQHPEADVSGFEYPVAKAMMDWMTDNGEPEYELHPNCYGLGIIKIGTGK